MRAVQFDAYGAVDCLELVELPDPEPGPGEVVIEVHACGVNRVDILSREGQTPTRVPLPHVSGTEVAGQIVAVGPWVAGWSTGDRVLVNPTQSCGHCTACRQGRDNMCRESRIYGVQTRGGYAELAVARAEHVLAIPASLSCESAAAIAVTAPTAWHMLMGRAALHMGEDVLIVAAGSGIGVLGIQIARLTGARVIATAGSEEKMTKASELGADVVVNHSDADWPRRVREATGGRGVDVVFEHVGAATWEGSLTALARGGRLVTCGGHSGFDVSINLWNLFVKEQTLIGSFAGTRRDLEHVLDLAAAGRLRPVIQDRFDLPDAAAAQMAMEDRGVFGKLLICPRVGDGV